VVEKGLERHWSPQQISARLRIDFPDEPDMWISHEAIYQALFVDSRRALPRDLAKRLRTRRVHRRPRGRRQGGPLRNMVPIENRPAEINRRTSPGHWEGDLIIGRGGRSAVATLVERQTRYTVLVALPGGRTAASVTAALTSTFNAMTPSEVASLTWDQGKRWPTTRRCQLRPASRSTSANPRAPGSAARTRTPTGSYANTCPKAPTSRRCRHAVSKPSQMSSTIALDESSDG
jgi:IS30 family transposase